MSVSLFCFCYMLSLLLFVLMSINWYLCIYFEQGMKGQAWSLMMSDIQPHLKRSRLSSASRYIRLFFVSDDTKSKANFNQEIVKNDSNEPISKRETLERQFSNLSGTEIPPKDVPVLYVKRGKYRNSLVHEKVIMENPKQNSAIQTATYCDIGDEPSLGIRDFAYIFCRCFYFI